MTKPGVKIWPLKTVKLRADVRLPQSGRAAAADNHNLGALIFRQIARSRLVMFRLVYLVIVIRGAQTPVGKVNQ